MLLKPRYYFICFFLFIIQAELFAQTDFTQKLIKDCNCPEFDLSKSYMEILDIAKSTNEIEIRLCSFSMGYDSFSIISYNKKKYSAVFYIAKNPRSSFYSPRPGESPLNRYVINSANLDSVMNELLHSGISNWKNPGFKSKRYVDLGVLVIQYKINQHTGTYKVQPAFALVQEYPEIEAYKDLSRIVETFKLMTDSVSRLNQKKSKK